MKLQLVQAMEIQIIPRKMLRLVPHLKQLMPVQAQHAGRKIRPSTSPMKKSIIPLPGWLTSEVSRFFSVTIFTLNPLKII